MSKKLILAILLLLPLLVTPVWASIQLRDYPSAPATENLHTVPAQSFDCIFQGDIVNTGTQQYFGYYAVQLKVPDGFTVNSVTGNVSYGWIYQGDNLFGSPPAGYTYRCYQANNFAILNAGAHDSLYFKANILAAGVQSKDKYVDLVFYYYNGSSWVSGMDGSNYKHIYNCGVPYLYTAHCSWDDNTALYPYRYGPNTWISFNGWLEDFGLPNTNVRVIITDLTSPQIIYNQDSSRSSFMYYGDVIQTFSNAPSSGPFINGDSYKVEIYAYTNWDDPVWVGVEESPRHTVYFTWDNVAPGPVTNYKILGTTSPSANSAYEYYTNNTSTPNPFNLIWDALPDPGLQSYKVYVYQANSNNLMSGYPKSYSGTTTAPLTAINFTAGNRYKIIVTGVDDVGNEVPLASAATTHLIVDTLPPNLYFFKVNDKDQVDPVIVNYDVNFSASIRATVPAQAPGNVMVPVNSIALQYYDGDQTAANTTATTWVWPNLQPSGGNGFITVGPVGGLSFATIYGPSGLNTTLITDGVKTLKATVTDGAGNVSNFTRQLYLDLSAPDKPNFTSPSGNYVNSLATISGTAHDRAYRSTNDYVAGGSGIKNVQIRITKVLTGNQFNYLVKNTSTGVWGPSGSIGNPNWGGDVNNEVWHSTALGTPATDTTVPWTFTIPATIPTGIFDTWNDGDIYLINVKCMDNVDRVSDVKSSTVTIDKAAPTGTMEIQVDNNFTDVTYVAGLYTMNPKINVHLSVTGDPANEHLSTKITGDITDADSSYVSYTNSDRIKNLNNAADGPKTINVSVIDDAGNELPLSGSVTLDKAAPDGTITITPTGTNNGVRYSNSRDVSLVLIATDGTGSGVDKVRVWEDGQTEPTSWRPSDYYSTRTFNLTADTIGLTPKTVNVKFQDRAGNPSPMRQDTIVLDTKFPQAPIITIPENSKSYLTGLYIKGTAKDVLVSGLKGGSGIKQVVIWVRRVNPNPIPNQYLYWHADAWQASNTLNDPAMTLEANLHIQTIADQPDNWDQFINLVIDNPSEAVDIKARVFDAAGNTEISSGVDITVSNTVAFNLSPGVNWVSIPLSGPTAVYNAQTIHIDTANDLWNALGLQDVDGDLIEVPIPGTPFYGQFYGGPSKPWNNFPVSFGKCYRVTTKFAKTNKQISGTVPTPAAENHLFSLSPAPGVYWIYLPATKQNITKASELWSDLALVAGDLIERSYPAGSAAYQYYGGTPSLGTDFSVSVGDCLRVTTQNPIIWP